jgi:ureidoglycolate lyase
MPLAVEELTADSFAPFGRVVAAPHGEPDAAGGGPWRWWAQTALLDRGDRPYAVGYLRLDAASKAFDWAERHAESEEMVIPVAGEMLLYAAAPEPRDFRVFRVGVGQAVILGKGVWHGAPLASGAPAAALVLLAEGTGELDTDKVQFEELAVEEGR